MRSRGCTRSLHPHPAGRTAGQRREGARGGAGVLCASPLAGLFLPRPCLCSCPQAQASAACWASALPVGGDDLQHVIQQLERLHLAHTAVEGEMGCGGARQGLGGEGRVRRRGQGRGGMARLSRPLRALRSAEAGATRRQAAPPPSPACPSPACSLGRGADVQRHHTQRRLVQRRGLREAASTREAEGQHIILASVKAPASASQPQAQRPKSRLQLSRPMRQCQPPTRPRSHAAPAPAARGPPHTHLITARRMGKQYM